MSRKSKIRRIRNADRTGKLNWKGAPRNSPDRQNQSPHRRKRKQVYVDSLGDIFSRDVPKQFIKQLFEIMRKANAHIFQLLTKRSARLRDLSAKLHWPDNVWMGVSVENDQYAFRADDLRATKAKVKFLSLEPLLGPLPHLDLTGIDWVIVGGESKINARRMKAEWVRDIRDQCVAAGVPFYFKQWGLYDERGKPVGKKQAGQLLDGRLWEQTPHSPQDGPMT